MAVPVLQLVSFQDDHAAALIPLVLGLSCLYVGVGVPFGLPMATLVTVCMSIVICLYAVVLVFLGTEDVGGPLISVPVAVALLVFATYNVVRACIATGAPDDAA
jgi:hypothetical protein